MAIISTARKYVKLNHLVNIKMAKVQSVMASEGEKKTHYCIKNASSFWPHQEHALLDGKGIKAIVEKFEDLFQGLEQL